MIGLRASQQDGTHPRPLLLRDDYVDLDGEWGFAIDDGDRGVKGGWHSGDLDEPFSRRIRVPFTMEAPLSGIGDPEPHSIVWYRRTFSVTRREDERVIVHFGAVDYHARVWVDGALVTEHVGGQTAFSADITDSLADTDGHVIVVRVDDVLDDPDRPRGKQDWRREAHAVWYRRATGIWKSVWLETVHELHIVDLDWRFDARNGRLDATIWLNSAPGPDVTLEITLEHDGEQLAQLTVSARDRRVEASADLPALRNGQEADRLLWSPAHPALIDAEVVLTSSGEIRDTAWSYTGLRSIGTGGGAFVLNGRPTYLRSVLEQGYWPDGVWTAPSAGHLRSEVEAILDLGFNAVRVHQKVEDPRFLFWCDRLGVLVWAEIGAAYGFSPDAVEMFAAEWMDSVRQRRSHPSIVAWVPFNESWGVHDLAHSAAEQSFVRGIVELTRALDPGRPIISNDGWEHVASDILSIHDYTADPELITQRYGTNQGVEEVIAGPGPAERRVCLPGQTLGEFGNRLPLMLTEFGGIAFRDGDTWGYSVVADEAEFASAVAGVFKATNESQILAGFCYTQLTDTAQEANGLLREDRTPKLPVDQIKRMVRG